MSSFGSELRKRRQEQGFSLRVLAGRVNYAFGHVSKVESGVRTPTREFAEAADRELGADRALLELIEQQQRQQHTPTGPSDVPADLPPVGPVVGRESDLAALSTAAAAPSSPGASPVLTLDGAPGVGKTSVALRWAHSVREQYPDGQLHADLRGFDPSSPPADPTNVAEEFLRRLGTPSSQIPAELGQRSELLRSMLDGRRMLIVLDNARDSEQVLPLIPATPQVVVVVTSRTRLLALGVRAGAIRSQLHTLGQREAHALLQQLIGPERTSAEPRAVRLLASRCDYLPLALRIVGEHVALHPHHPLGELAAELEHHHERLAALDAAGEHVALSPRAALDWSYQALEPVAAALFRALGLHPGAEFSVGAAAALAGESFSATRRQLERLASLHLVEEIARDRYRAHDLVRLFAADRSGAEDAEHERAVAVARCVRWYLHTARAANRLIAPQQHLPELASEDGEDADVVAASTVADEQQALSWCDHEVANLVHVAGLARQYGLDEHAWRLAAVSMPYFQLRKRWNAWLAAHQHALAAAREAGDRDGQAWAQHNLGRAHLDLRQFDEAAQQLTEAIELRRKLEDLPQLAWSLLAAGGVAIELGQLDTAIADLHEAVGTFRRHGDTYGRAWALSGLGSALRKLRRLPEAASVLHQALDAFATLTEADDGAAAVLVRLGGVEHDRGGIATAMECFQRALTLRPVERDQWGHAEVLLEQGRALLVHGDRPDQAHSCLSQAAQLFHALHDPRAAEAQAELDRLDDGAGDEDE